jgi:hypothetical protein
MLSRWRMMRNALSTTVARIDLGRKSCFEDTVHWNERQSPIPTHHRSLPFALKMSPPALRHCPRFAIFGPHFLALSDFSR